MKRDTIIIRFVTLFLATICSLPSMAYDFMVDGLCYNINSDGTSVTVTYEKLCSINNQSSYSNLSRELIIPDSVIYNNKVYTITSIGEKAFWGCDIVGVTICNSVTAIGDSAFSYNSNLRNITIPNSLTSIGDYAFKGCENLTSEINLPNTLSYIGEGAFYNCRNLTGCIVIPNLVTEILDNVFWRCFKITKVILCEGVTTIGGSSFHHCTSLTQADLPNTLVSIGNNAFADCPNLTDVKIPESVTSIGMQAFMDIACIDAVPDGLEYVGANALRGTQWYDNQPEGLVYAGLVAYQYKGTMPDGTDVVFKDGTKGISGFCFFAQKGMKSVTIPNTITNIEEAAFSGCSNLTNVIIPNSVSLLGHGVFSGCLNLESISLGNSVDKIGEKAFYNCKKLKNIIIPNSVSSISSEAFRGCDTLQSVTIGSNVALIWKDVFKECRNLTEVHSEIQNPFAVRFYSYNDIVLTPFDYNTRRGYLFVPAGTKEDYMAADVWKDFQHIVCLNEPITGLELSPKAAEVLEGGQVTITPTFTPWYATEQTLTWASSDTTIATVNEQGVVTGVKVGTATISATTTDGSDITATCQVTVKPVVATDITLEPLTVTITAGETYEFALTVAPDNATYKAARWTSSDEAVATVDENGVVTGIAAGQAQVTATTIDGTNLSATSVVTVMAPKASSITIAPDSATLDIGGSVRLTTTIAPENVESTVVLWQSSDEDVAIVTSKGLVYGVGAGQALITATTTDGTNLSDTCHVTVRVPFELSAQDLAVPVNTLRNIPVTIDNHVPVKSFAFTLTVPEGIDYVGDAVAAPRCSEFNITTTYNTDSTVMRIEGVMTNRAMEAGTAPFVLLPIKSSEYIDNFVLSLSEIAFTSTNDGVGTQGLNDITVTMRVLDLGDVNGDKIVDVDDVNTLINFILDLETDLTNFGVGDMNDDGKIDVDDVNAIINLILGVK